MDGPFPRLGGPPLRPLHPAVIEEQLAAQHQEIQGLLIDNQRLAATHVALKQELAAAQHELRRVAHAVGAMHANNDSQLREMYEKSMKLESELRVAEAMKAELMQVRGDIQKLNSVRQELTEQVQVLSQDVTRATADLQQTPLLKAEVENMKQEVQRVRPCDGENLIAMAREVEKLRAEVANRNYLNPSLAYGGNPYSAAYAMNRASGAPPEAADYSTTHAPWGGAYDAQRTHGHR
ncbi:unnamed protein product [Spirodela intermedia]|uniref:Uncharacterized protein n=1 Tax=Spirodela intermedia TaxID=51605 RepID=A0A7I8JQB5_SPIIN|nr:unnamed protein product [Spirodela intermedia]CAA6671995.1 unnamed protein product [Spirodela intermedia]